MEAGLSAYENNVPLNYFIYYGIRQYINTIMPGLTRKLSSSSRSGKYIDDFTRLVYADHEPLLLNQLCNGDSVTSRKILQIELKHFLDVHNKDVYKPVHIPTLTICAITLKCITKTARDSSNSLFAVFNMRSLSNIIRSSHGSTRHTMFRQL